MHLFSGHEVLIVDELGYLPIPAEDAASLFQVISRRYQKGSIILTATAASPPGEISSPTAPSRRPCWTGYSTEASCFTISGDSYRLRAYHAQAIKHRPKGGAS